MSFRLLGPKIKLDSFALRKGGLDDDGTKKVSSAAAAAAAETISD